MLKAFFLFLPVFMISLAMIIGGGAFVGYTFVNSASLGLDFTDVGFLSENTVNIFSFMFGTSVFVLGGQFMNLLVLK